MITLILAVFGLPSLVSFIESPAYFYVYALQTEIISKPIRLSTLLGGIIALIWIVFCAGRAFEVAGYPEIAIKEELTVDVKHFRLGLTSKRKDFKTRVRLMDIVSSDLTPFVPGRFPLELEWSHHPGQSEIQLIAGFEEHVSIATLHPVTFGRVDLVFTGATHQGDIRLDVGQSAYFHLSIQHPRKPIERWFRFERINDVEFESFPEAPPLLTLLTSPSTSKHS